MSDPPRSDTFYRSAVAAGLILALFALAWGRWSLGQSRERLFAVDEQRAVAQASVAEQQVVAGRIEEYGATLQRAMVREKNRTPQRNLFLINETERTTRRIQNAQIELERRRGLEGVKDRQAKLLQRQMEIDASRSDGMTVLGLTLAVTGLFLWYVRRQRPLDASLRSPAGEARRRQDLLAPWEDAVVWPDERPGVTEGTTGGREGGSPYAPN